MGDFVAWYKSYPSSVYTRIDSYLTGGFKPEYVNNRKNSFATISLKFNDKSFSDTLNFKTGDDIVICPDITSTSVKNNWCAGKVNEYSPTIKAIEAPDNNGNTRKQQEHSLVIEQRDFSSYPFELIYLQPVNLSDLLIQIFQNTRSDLGGVINGTTIDKFIMLCPDVALSDYNFKGTNKNHLIEAVNNRSGLKWQINAYCEPSTTNGINMCYQVMIYA